MVRDKALIIIGFTQIVGGVYVLAATLLLFPDQGGTIVVPEWIRFLILYSCLIISGIGIIFQKNFLFLITYYVYPNFILRRFDFIYNNLTAEYHGEDVEIMQKFFFFNSIEKILIAAFLFSILLFLSRKSIVQNYNQLTQKALWKHACAGVLIYLLFFRL